MKKYLDKSVYEATNERIKYIFDNFDNIYVSFSGGKDSGLLLNLVLDYKRRNNIKRKIGVFHQDFEAQYNQWAHVVQSVTIKCIGTLGIRMKKTNGSEKCPACLIL